MYQGVTHTNCTTAGYGSRPWCADIVEDDGTYANFMYCDTIGFQCFERFSERETGGALFKEELRTSGELKH